MLREEGQALMNCSPTARRSYSSYPSMYVAYDVSAKGCPLKPGAYVQKNLFGFIKLEPSIRRFINFPNFFVSL